MRHDSVSSCDADREPLAVLVLYNLDSTWNEADVAEVLEAVEGLCQALRRVGHETRAVEVWGDVEGSLQGYDPGRYVVFNWCEGLDGQPHSEHVVAATLERLGFTYTGAGPRSLADTTDKVRMKRLMCRAGVSTPIWGVRRLPEPGRWRRYPAIVKPALEHASFGITPQAVVDEPRELAARVAYVRDVFGHDAVVEEFIDGREFHVSVWGNGRLEVLPLVEMDFSAFADHHDRLCSFDSKWEPESLPYRLIETLCPAPVEPYLQQRIEDVARRAYRALGCRDYARMDIRVRGGVPYVLDVNTNPDIVPDSSFTLAAEEVGLDYGALVDRIVRLAAERGHGLLSADSGNGLNGWLSSD